MTLLGWRFPIIRRGCITRRARPVKGDTLNILSSSRVGSPSKHSTASHLLSVGVKGQQRHLPVIYRTDKSLIITALRYSVIPHGREVEHIARAERDFHRFREVRISGWADVWFFRVPSCDWNLIRRLVGRYHQVFMGLLCVVPRSQSVGRIRQVLFIHARHLDGWQ